MTQSTTQNLVYELLLFLRPVSSEQKFNSFLEEFEWLPSGFSDFEFDEKIGETLLRIEGDLELFDSGGDFDAFIVSLKELVGVIQWVYRIDSIRGLGKKLFDELLHLYLRVYHPAWLAALEFFGIASSQRYFDEEEGVSSFQREFHWENMRYLFKPGELVEDIYHWGSVDLPFEAEVLLSRLDALGLGLGLASGFQMMPYALGKFFFYPPGVEDSEIDPEVWFEHKALYFPIVQIPSESGQIKAGVWLVPIPDQSDFSPPIRGLAVVPFAEGEYEFRFRLSETLRLLLDIDFNLDRDFGISLLPTQVETFGDHIEGGAEELLNGGIQIRLIQEKEGEKIIPFGGPKSTHFEYQDLQATLGLAKRDEGWDFGFNFQLNRAALVIHGNDGDGLTSQVFPRRPVELRFDLGFGWSLVEGFYIKGGAGFEYTVQVNRTFGPITIQTVEVELVVDESKLSLDTGVNASVELGPFKASIEKVGYRSTLDWNTPGILGNASIDIGFKFPTGIGLEVDALSLQGGGFLSLDPPNYFGILSLSLLDKIDLTVIGLVSTELPGGESGYSMMLSVLAQFQSVQLGLGFALDGVGGLVGIHRSTSEDGLRKVMKNHSLDWILFPEDPIKDATRIFDAIQSVFPGRKDHHSFGLMALISWGHFLIKGSLGIVIEVGRSGKLAILGTIRVALPHEDAALISLNMDVLGFFDFGKQTVAIDASLFNSKILIFSVSGDMALRVNYSETNPDFAFSVGGFFPGYQPTIEFPKLNRSLLKVANNFAEIRFESYFAITSNSIQKGAELSLRAKFGAIELSGASGYDAILYFNPFAFETLFYLWANIKFSGKTIANLDLRVMLSGPNPFHAHGYVKISFFFFSVKVNFDATFGDKKSEVSTEISPYNLLYAEIKDSRNLTCRQPDWSTMDVVMTPRAQESGYLDPLGSFVFSQRTVPLRLEMERYAFVSISHEERYLDLHFSGERSEIEKPVKGKFAPAQFFNWSDKEKIQAPAFESFVHGIQCESRYEAGPQTTTVFRNHETVVWDKSLAEPGINRYPFEQNLLLSPGAKRDLQLQRGRKRFQPGRQTLNPAHKKFVAVSEYRYVVVSSLSRDQRGLLPTTGDHQSDNMTYAEAFQSRKKLEGEEWQVRSSGFESKLEEKPSTGSDAIRARLLRTIRDASRVLVNGLRNR